MRTFFGFTKNPFSSDLRVDEILQTDALKSLVNRFEYALEIGGIVLITGDIGSGKSTGLRYAMHGLHPSEYHVFYVTASSGSILEFYRLFLGEIGLETGGYSRAVMVRKIKSEIRRIVLEKKMKVVLIIDEASLLRLEVFSELHTLVQFEQDSKPWLPVVLSGQPSLKDNLTYPSSRPFSSRIVAISHIEGASLAGMRDYLTHHIKIAGIKTNLFEDAAVTAIHQGSGGIFRKANHLARGALVAACNDRSKIVTAEHVRLASTEIL